MRSTLTGLGLSMALLAVPAQAAESEIGETSITIGYTVELKQLDTGLIYQALSTGAVDTFFSAWMPGQQSYLNKLGDKIDIIGTASGPAPGGLVVPGYAPVAALANSSKSRPWPTAIVTRFRPIIAVARC